LGAAVAALRPHANRSALDGEAGVVDDHAAHFGCCGGQQCFGALRLVEQGHEYGGEQHVPGSEPYGAERVA
jgi:hypothetical protein